MIAGAAPWIQDIAKVSFPGRGLIRRCQVDEGLAEMKNALHSEAKFADGSRVVSLGAKSERLDAFFVF
jgi:urease gamma subunit